MKAHWCSSNDTMISSKGRAWAMLKAFFAGIRNFPCVPLFERGTFFSTSLKESVATAVSTPPSIERYTLASSGRITEDDAQEVIEVKRERRRTPGSTILF